MTSPSALPPLSLLQTRVLGVLVEKRHTVPDSYPLTLNALAAGCNQKSSRDPVLEASDAEIQAAIDYLKRLSLVVESSGGRVMRYAHNVDRVLQVPSQAVALLATLMLRGPQTVGELRINSERLHAFADLSAVQGFLDELAVRSAGPLVVLLPRQRGEREARWAHLLSGMPEIADAAPEAAPAERVAVGELATLRSQVEALQQQVGRLQSTVDRLCAELGTPPDRPPG